MKIKLHNFLTLPKNLFLIENNSFIIDGTIPTVPQEKLPQTSPILPILFLLSSPSIIISSPRSQHDSPPLFILTATIALYLLRRFSSRQPPGSIPRDRDTPCLPQVSVSLHTWPRVADFVQFGCLHHPPLPVLLHHTN